MDLPEVQVVGLQRAQRFLEIGLRALAAAFRRFGGEEDLLAKWRQDVAVHLFRLAVPVDAGAIEVVDAEVVGAPGDRLGVLVAAHGEAAAGLPDDGELLPGLAEDAPGNFDACRLGARNTAKG